MSLVVRAVDMDGRESSCSNVVVARPSRAGGTLTLLPRTLNRVSAGSIMAGIELGAGYSAKNVVRGSLTLNGVGPEESVALRDVNGRPELLVRFPRRAVGPALARGHGVPVVVEGLLLGCVDTIGFTVRDTIRVVGPGSPQVEGPPADSAEVQKAPGTSLPTAFAFYRPSPNPALGGCDLAFDLPQASPVRLLVFDVHGRLISSVVNRAMPAGRHRVRWDASSAPAGLYFARITAAGHSAVWRVALVR